jgi:hypothetical protein
MIDMAVLGMLDDDLGSKIALVKSCSDIPFRTALDRKMFCDTNYDKHRHDQQRSTTNQAPPQPLSREMRAHALQPHQHNTSLRLQLTGKVEVPVS